MSRPGRRVGAGSRDCFTRDIGVEYVVEYLVGKTEEEDAARYDEVIGV